MIRNGGKRTTAQNDTNNSATHGATGIYDTFDAYSAKVKNRWPIPQVFSSAITHPLALYEYSYITVVNNSLNLENDIVLSYEIVNVDGNATSIISAPFNNSYNFIQSAATNTGSFSVSINTPQFNPSRIPYTFKINILYNGIIINTSNIITIPVPIPTVSFVTGGGDYSIVQTNIDEGDPVNSNPIALMLRWANIGNGPNSGSPKTYNITWSGTASVADFSYYSSLPTTFQLGAYYNYQSLYGAVSLYPIRDFLTEGTESLTATITDATNGYAIGSASFTINDTSLTATTIISVSKTSIYENETVRVNIEVQNLGNFNYVNYFIVGSAASKFTTTSGYVDTSAGATYIDLTPVNNYIYGEPDTSFQVQFRNNDETGYLFGTTPVITVKDAIQPTATVTYTSNFNEGTTNQFVVTTTNYTDQTITWAITATTGTLTPSDFFTATSGTLTLTNNVGTINVKPRNDTYTEGTETFKLEIRATGDNSLLKTVSFTINDTSTGTSEVQDLYSFSSFTFLPGNALTNVASGDSLSTLLSYYNTTTYPWLTNTSYYNVTTPGIQQWTVPTTGIYRFSVAGAQGGYYYNNNPGVSTGVGGGGAILNGDVILTKGTVLNIVVGKAGQNAGSTTVGGGGGGGTFVYTGAIGGTGLLFAAGGGGGADDSVVEGQSARSDFYAGTNNAAVRTNPTDGNGAPAGGAGGGSGCGWLSDSTGTGAGLRFTGGAAFGAGGVGGFGGGGGDQDDGGAGGGYTGGTSTTATSGGCGGSYVNLNDVVYNYSWGGTNANPNSTFSNANSGYVTITSLGTLVTATVIPSTTTITEGQTVTFNVVTTNYPNGSVALIYNLITNTGSISTNDTAQNLSGTINIVDSVGSVSFTFNSDTFTEGTESFSLLVYYNELFLRYPGIPITKNYKYAVATSAVVTVQDTSIGSAPAFSILNNIVALQYSQYPTTLGYYEIYTPSSVSGLIEAAKGWTVLQNATLDDGFVTVPLPFNFKIDNTNYTSAYVGSNAYITFGAGSIVHTVVATSLANVIPNPKLIWSGGDNSMQRCLYRVDAKNRFVLIRYEGNSSISGTLGSPGIIAEIKLFNSQFTGGLSVIEIKFQTSRAVSASSAKLTLSSASAYYYSYNFASTATQYNCVFYATNSTATAWNFVGDNIYGANNSVVVL